MESLTRDYFSYILLFLTPKEVYSCQRINKLFYDLINSSKFIKFYLISRYQAKLKNYIKLDKSILKRIHFIFDTSHLFYEDGFIRASYISEKFFIYALELPERILFSDYRRKLKRSYRISQISSWKAFKFWNGGRKPFNNKNHLCAFIQGDTKYITVNGVYNLPINIDKLISLRNKLLSSRCCDSETFKLFFSKIFYRIIEDLDLPPDEFY